MQVFFFHIVFLAESLLILEMGVCWRFSCWEQSPYKNNLLLLFRETL